MAGTDRLVRIVWVVALLGVALSALPISRSSSDGSPPLDAPTRSVESSLRVPVSLHPRITVRGANRIQLARLAVALGRFSEAELALPDLVIEFHPDRGFCGGHGRFNDDQTPWRIQICSDMDAVYEHELAHAWERANLDDDTRRAFMDLRGYAHWRGRDLPWNQRGVEGVAFIIQQGISGLPLPPGLGGEWRSRLEAFEMLTQRPAPTLVEWMATREVPCHQRPTRLSAMAPDAGGAVCGTASGRSVLDPK